MDAEPNAVTSNGCTNSVIDSEQNLNVDDLLDTLHRNCSLDRISVHKHQVIAIINKFENDPFILNRSLAKIIKNLINIKFITEIDLCNGNHFNLMVSISHVYYELSKIVSNKNIGIHLSTDISNLNVIVRLYQFNKRNIDDRYSWQLEFFLLSWLNVLVESPFKFKNDRMILDIMNNEQDLINEFAKFDIFKLKSKVIANLMIKNLDLFNLNVLSKNFTLLNSLLKKMINLPINKILAIITPNKYEITELTNNVLLLDISMENEINQKNLLKIYNNLFKINYYMNNKSLIIKIIKLFEKKMIDFNIINNSEFRFTLSTKYSNVIAFLNFKIKNTKLVNQIIMGKVNQTIKILEDENSYDMDILHLNLLFIAENIKILLINNSTDINELFEKIFFKTINFQRLELNNNNSINIRGKHIRDATNFILWSILRANSETITKKTIDTVFLYLLTSSLYDMELIIRKSANAALQELLGRYNRFLDLDNSKIMKIVELSNSNLHTNYNKNTIELYMHTFNEPNNKFYWENILDWMIKFNFSKQNNNLNIFLLNLELINNILSYSEDSSGMEKIFVDSIEQNHDKYNPDRLLLIYINYYSHGNWKEETKKYILTQINKNFNSIMSNIVINKGSINTPFKSFMILAVLEYFNFKFYLEMKNTDKIPTLTDTNINPECLELILKVLDMTTESSMFYDEIKKNINKIIFYLSRNDGIFVNEEIKRYFWLNFQDLLNRSKVLACTSLPFLYQEYFFKNFLKLLPNMRPYPKSILLESLTPHLEIIFSELASSGDRFLLKKILINLLNDYTITEQGDVGRLVRTKTLKLIADNFELFLGPNEYQESADLKDDLINYLLKLLGEPQLEISNLSFNILKIYYGYVANSKLSNEHNILTFQHKFFGGNSRAFWEGYLMTGGAIHSTDIQLQSSIDSFLYYYNNIIDDTNSVKSISRLELCNELIRIIPSSKDIIAAKKSSIGDPLSGAMGRDILKVTTSYLLFWKRILESSINIHQDFNYKGVYAKFYNLQILKGSSMLKSLTIKVLPFLVISESQYKLSSPKNDLANIIILRLLQLIKKEAKLMENHSSQKLSGSPTFRAAMEALTQIHLHFNNLEKLNLIKSIADDIRLLYNIDENSFSL